MKKKNLTLALCMVLLVVVSVMGTLAYLTSTAEVVNTFTVGNVEIILDETLVNADGVPVDEDGNIIAAGETVIRKPQGNEYHLIPGKSYTKDPIVTVKGGGEDSYVRMLVTINNKADLQAALGTDFLPQNYVAGWDSSVWPCVNLTDNGDDTVTYEFRYAVNNGIVSKNTTDTQLPPLFDSFTLPGGISADEVGTLSDLEITVVGHAIQASGFADENTAWTAFDAEN